MIFFCIIIPEADETEEKAKLPGKNKQDLRVKINWYKTPKFQEDPTEIIYLDQFASIKINGQNSFILIHSLFDHSNRTFKALDESMLNKWIKMIEPHLLYGAIHKSGTYIIGYSAYKPTIKVEPTRINGKKSKESNLYWYKAREMDGIRRKAVDIIDLREFTKIEINDHEGFTLLHDEGQKKNKTFKCYNKDVMNEWMKMIRPHLACDEFGNRIIPLFSDHPMMRKEFDGAKIYYDKTIADISKPKAYIDLNQVTSIKSIDRYTFVIIKGALIAQCRTFKSDRAILVNKWMDDITSVMNENNSKQYSEMNKAVETAKQDGTINQYYQYVHRVSQQEINCPSMKKLQSKDPLDCNIYNNLKKREEFTAQNLLHMKIYRHHANNYEDKEICKYGDECKSYIRNENGLDQNRIDDKCHMLLYRHPPRTRRIKLAENVHSLIINKSSKDNHALYEPTFADKDKHQYNDIDGWLKALVLEVQTNDFGYDLCTACRQNEECKHNVYDSKYSILVTVDQKMNCLRHRMMNKTLNHGEMLALILYTGLMYHFCELFDIIITLFQIGCECNYDLCSSQRNGDYDKWKYFDYCLWNAIQKLSSQENGKYPVYSGLNGVKINEKVVTNGYFVTYVSTSWQKNVSEAFTQGNGMMIHFDEEFTDRGWIRCCDVSWISKFPDECEILFARSVQDIWNDNNNFKCEILEEANGIQTILLTKK